jgi:hypothetical protein
MSTPVEELWWTEHLAFSGHHTSQLLRCERLDHPNSGGHDDHSVMLEHQATKSSTEPRAFLNTDNMIAL